MEVNFMKVDTALHDTQPLLQSAATRGTFQADFQSMLETAKQSYSQAGESKIEPKAGLPRTSQMTPAEYLADYVRKSPAQHLRDAILKEMGLTEEDLAAMPPEKRAAVEHTIAERIKEVLQRQSGSKQIEAQQAVASVLSLST
jgi:hypothetical protein